MVQEDALKFKAWERQVKDSKRKRGDGKKV